MIKSYALVRRKDLHKLTSDERWWLPVFNENNDNNALYQVSDIFRNLSSIFKCVRGVKDYNELNLQIL